MLSHSAARLCVIQGFQEVFGRAPTQIEAQLCQAVGLLEGSYGAGWGIHDTGYGSNNWGAVQAGSSWKGETFEHKDSSPDDKTGLPHWYVTKFRKYPTPQAGATDLVRAVYSWHGRNTVLAAASAADVYAFSVELHVTGYYEGFGKTVADRIANHHKAVVNALHIITKAMGEDMPADTITTDPEPHARATLMLGSKGDDVEFLQAELGLEADGSFGPLTRAAVIQFQRDHGLKPDGWVGRATWSEIAKLT